MCKDFSFVHAVIPSVLGAGTQIPPMVKTTERKWSQRKDNRDPNEINLVHPCNGIPWRRLRSIMNYMNVKLTL